MSENEMNVQTPTFEEPVVAKPKNKKGLLIGIAAVVVVAIIAAIVIGALSATPMGLLATGFGNSMKALEGDEMMDFLEQVGNGGSMEASLDLSALLEQSGLPISGTGTIKFYMEEEATVLNLGVLLAETQKLDATLYANQDSVALASQWLLGDKAYGMNLSNLEESFNNSVFGPNGAFSLGIEVPENFQEQLDQYATYNEASEKIAMELGAYLLKTLEKHSDVSKADATVTLGGENVKTTAVSITMDSKQLAALFEDMLNYVRNDEDIRAYLEDYAEILFTQVAYGALSADAMVEEFYKSLDEAAAEMDEMKKEMEEEEAGLEAVFHISKSGKQLIGVELLLESNAEPGKISFYAGPDLKDVKEITFRVDSEEEAFCGTYVITANDKNQFASQLKVQEDGETVMDMQTTWDKQTGSWEIKAIAEGEEVVAFRGTLKREEKTASLTIQSVESYGQTAELGLDIVLNASDKMPEMPQYTDLMKMTEEEVNGIVNDLYALIFQLALGQ